MTLAEMVNRLASSDKCSFSFSPPADEKLLREAEQALGLKLPTSYREFLQELNFGYIDNQEVRGLLTPLDNEDPWNAVSTTLNHRRQDGLPTRLIAFADVGNGEYYYLDTIDGRVVAGYPWSDEFDNEADSFEEWLMGFLPDS